MKSKLIKEKVVLKWQIGELNIYISSKLNIKIEGFGNLSTMNSMTKSFVALVVDGKEISDWNVDFDKSFFHSIRGPLGKGNRLRVKAINSNDFSSPINLNLDLEVYDDFPGSIKTRAKFDSSSEIKVDEIIMNRLFLDPLQAEGENFCDAWVYNGSGETREHHVQELTKNYYKKNYMGLLESYDGGGHQSDYRCGSQPGYGGGVPMVDVWTKGGGLGIGHTDVSFRFVNIPVEVISGKGISLSMTYNPRTTINANIPLVTYSGLVTLHKGDYFNGLNTYRQIMQNQGMKFNKSVSGSYEPQWDTWGFNADFTMDDIRETLPYLKEIGIKWLTLDDRWFDVNGDWMPRLDTFPGGEQTLIDFIEELHSKGFKVRLWTIPGEFDGKPDLAAWQKEHPTAAIELAKHPFHAESSFYKANKNLMVSAPDGSLEYSKRGNYFGQGKLPQVQTFFKKLTQKMFLEWKIDGLKQDAVYMSPPDYNESHGLANPDESGDGYAMIMKVIYETALECNPDAVIMNCPCGTPMTPQWMQWQNQAVTVDPWTSWVNRSVFKEMKALFGPQAPVVLDHIEISDEGEDFSILGVGGIPATRFTPSGRDKTNEIEDRIFEVRPFQEKLELWKHWFKIYNEMRLSEGVYLNLYDLIYDKPETHVISKNGLLYFSLYPGEPDGIVDDGGEGYRKKKDSKHWSGTFVFRGLENDTDYKIRDWENDIDLGIINSRSPKKELNVKHHLLLELTPLKK